MTVAELIAKLQEFPQDMPVYRTDRSYDYLSVNEAEIITISDDRAEEMETLVVRPKIEAVVLD